MCENWVKSTKEKGMANVCPALILAGSTSMLLVSKNLLCASKDPKGRHGQRLISMIVAVSTSILLVSAYSLETVLFRSMSQKTRQGKCLPSTTPSWISISFACVEYVCFLALCAGGTGGRHLTLPIPIWRPG